MGMEIKIAAYVPNKPYADQALISFFNYNHVKQWSILDQNLTPKSTPKANHQLITNSWITTQFNCSSCYLMSLIEKTIKSIYKTPNMPSILLLAWITQQGSSKVHVPSLQKNQQMQSETTYIKYPSSTSITTLTSHSLITTSEKTYQIEGERNYLDKSPL